MNTNTAQRPTTRFIDCPIPAQWDTQAELASFYEQGETLLVIAEGQNESSCFRLKDPRPKGLSHVSLVQIMEEMLAQMHFIELKITHRRVVSGQYRSDDISYGFLAQGSDGWTYSSQWNYMDDASGSPYQNWHRYLVPGTHFTLKGDQIDTWLIDKEKEFKGHWMNWEVTHYLGGLVEPERSVVQQYLNARFPASPLALCHTMARDPSNRVYCHDQYGLFRASSGCMYCQHLADQIIL